ncbi:MAG: hypothetical protein PHE09_08660 [Oscillospiraceae bacterium]|jgi:hypothetical protein|nr:hypothetical protein [Oscillospiraceae bacterium]HBR01496.1 hypothetical protein [Ruminiclostridium sp.]
MKQVSLSELRAMTDREGLILQGCGGDLQEWIDGINGLFTECGILKNGSSFTEVSTFEHDGCTNLLFPFEGVELDVGKLAIWRLSTHAQFGGTWLSDYVPNRLGGFVQEQQSQAKPDCPLIGADGNVFNLMGIAARTLKENGLAEQAKEMRERITTCGSYDETLGIIGQYVNIISVNEEQSSGFEMTQQF